MSVRKIILIGLLIVSAIALLEGLFVVRETEQVIVMRFGDPKREIKESGLYLKVPLFETAYYIDRRILRLDADPQEVVASDQKRLVVDAFARYRITRPLEMFKAARNEERVSRLLSDILDSSVRQVLGRESFPTIVSGERGSLMERIEAIVNARANSFGVEVVDVRLKRADLPQVNSKAIYERMNTEREREAREARAEGREQAARIRSAAERERTVLLAEAERDSQQARGQGDSTAIKIFAEAFSEDEEFYAFYRSMQAYRAALADGNTTVVLSPNSEFFRFFGDLGGADVRPKK
ncbi:MAG: protease modulator HflC [Pseudomonadota bacterium]